MNQLITSVLILLAPWGIYFLIKRVVFLAFEDFLSIFRAGVNLDATLRKKFDAAYDNNSLDEIVQVEEDAMYARLETLSNSRVNREKRKMHLNHIIEWASKNNYPGSKRQVDLLLVAIKANQKYPEILSQLSLHLSFVSRTMESAGDKKSKRFRKVDNHRDLIYVTPGSVSAWLTIFIYCVLVFIFSLLDELNLVTQILFWGIMIYSLYLSLGRLLIKFFVTKIGLALAITIIFSNIYSYWHHVTSDPKYYNFTDSNAEIQYPRWLSADDFPSSKDSCGQPIIINGVNNFSSFKIEYFSKDIDVFDFECNILSEIILEPTVSKDPSVFYVSPKSLSGLWKNKETTIKPIWTEPNMSGQREMQLQINFENLIWFYSRKIWGTWLAGTVVLILVDFFRSKLISSPR
jgi:hypothetical protein